MVVWGSDSFVVLVGVFRVKQHSHLLVFRVSFFFCAKPCPTSWRVDSAKSYTEYISSHLGQNGQDRNYEMNHYADRKWRGACSPAHFVHLGAMTDVLPRPLVGPVKCSKVPLISTMIISTSNGAGKLEVNERIFERSIHFGTLCACRRQM